MNEVKEFLRRIEHDVNAQLREQDHIKVELVITRRKHSGKLEITYFVCATKHAVLRADGDEDESSDLSLKA
jgi:hypothetical protein